MFESSAVSVWTDEEIAARISRLRHFVDEMERLDAIEPLPDNFDELCSGKAINPIYSKAHTS